MHKSGPIRIPVIPVIEHPARVIVHAVADLARCEAGRYVRSSLDPRYLIHGKSGTSYLLKDGDGALCEWPATGYVVEVDDVLGASVREGSDKLVNDAQREADARKHARRRSDP